jgi:hypothetical protein
VSRSFEFPPGPDSPLIRCLTEFLLSDIAKIQLIFPIRQGSATQINRKLIGEYSISHEGQLAAHLVVSCCLLLDLGE